MEFQSGDDVVHPSYGVGSVVRVEERRLAEENARRYYMIIFGKTTAWLPVETAVASGLRPVTPPCDLDRYRTLLKGRPTELDRDHKKRRLDINEQLMHGSFQIVCEVVRDLTARGWYRPLTGLDASMLSKVRATLCEEWATASSQPLPAATYEVNALLEAGEQTYKSSAVPA
jgi:RNA polymerase-interacting CarD/CdnL/TRCF family regulator